MMNIPDALEVLKSEKIHTVLIGVGALIFVLSLTTDVKVLTNLQGLLLGSALFFMGIGEMTFNGSTYVEKTYLTKTVLIPVDTWKLSIHGVALFLLGIVLAVLFLNDLF